MFRESREVLHPMLNWFLVSILVRRRSQMGRMNQVDFRLFYCTFLGPVTPSQTCCSSNIARRPALERVAHWSHIKKTKNKKKTCWLEKIQSLILIVECEGRRMRRHNGIPNRMDGWVWLRHETNSGHQVWGGGLAPPPPSHFSSQSAPLRLRGLEPSDH